MPKYASFGYKKMSKFNLIFGHPKNHPNFSNFFDSKNVHNYTGQEFDNELRPKLNNNFLTDGKFSISTLIDKIVNFLLTAGKFLFSSLTDKIFEEHLISPSMATTCLACSMAPGHWRRMRASAPALRRSQWRSATLGRC